MDKTLPCRLPNTEVEAQSDFENFFQAMLQVGRRRDKNQTTI
jgi:hypothetical protein